MEHWRHEISPLFGSCWSRRWYFCWHFLSLRVALGPFPDSDAPAALLTGFAGVSGMAIQNAVQRVHFASIPPTTLMTGNTTQAVLDAVDLLRRAEPTQAAAIRARFGRTFPQHRLVRRRMCSLRCSLLLGRLLESLRSQWQSGLRPPFCASKIDRSKDHAMSGSHQVTAIAGKADMCISADGPPPPPLGPILVFATGPALPTEIPANAQEHSVVTVRWAVTNRGVLSSLYFFTNASPRQPNPGKLHCCTVKGTWRRPMAVISDAGLARIIAAVGTKATEWPIDGDGLRGCLKLAYRRYRDAVRYTSTASYRNSTSQTDTDKKDSEAP